MDESEDLSSDTSDDDYMPGEESEGEVVSDCREGSASEDDLTAKQRTTSSAKRKRNNGNFQSARKKLSGGIRLDDEDNDNDVEVMVESVDEQTECVKACNNDEENNKKRADDLWSSFKKDVETTTTKTKASDDESTSASSPKLASSPKKSVPITVTKVYDYAGEEVRVTETLETGSNRPAKYVVVQPDPLTSTVSAALAEPSAGGTKKPTGLGNILNKLGAKKKISTLEKSRLDWNQFKHQEGIEEELTTFNKGKEGFLEKQAFLQRADLRQFEIERNLRMTNRSNR